MKYRTTSTFATRPLASLATAAALLTFPGASVAHAADPSVCDVSPTVNGANLVSAINAIQPGGGIITLASYCVYSFTAADNGINALPVITSAITINGNNATIERDPTTANDFRIFQVDAGGALTMDTLSILNGSASTVLGGNPGGAVYLTDSNTALTTTDVNFQGNHSDNVGGAIVAAGSATVSLTGGVISDNSSDEDGGGLEYITDIPSGSLTLDSVTVTRNRSLASGGGISYHAFLTQPFSITDSTITHNTAALYGGGVQISNGSVATPAGSITGTTINDNDVTASTRGGGGIRVNGYTLTLTDSTVAGNTLRGSFAGTGAQRSGGGVLADAGAVILDGTSVSGNRTVGVGGQGGGAAVTGGSLSLTNGTTVTGNLVSGQYSRGGGVYADDSSAASVLTVADSSITGNKATGTGSQTGGLYNNNTTAGSAVLTNATITGNSSPAAPAPGGAYSTSAIAGTGTTSITLNTPTNCLFSPATITPCVN